MDHCGGDDDGHDSYCFICKKACAISSRNVIDDELFYCDECNHTQHATCSMEGNKPTNDSISWRCDACFHSLKNHSSKNAIVGNGSGTGGAVATEETAAEAMAVTVSSVGIDADEAKGREVSNNDGVVKKKRKRRAKNNENGGTPGQTVQTVQNAGIMKPKRPYRRRAPKQSRNRRQLQFQQANANVEEKCDQTQSDTDSVFEIEFDSAFSPLLTNACTPADFSAFLAALDLAPPPLPNHEYLPAADTAATMAMNTTNTARSCISDLVGVDFSVGQSSFTQALMKRVKTLEDENRLLQSMLQTSRP